MAKMAAVKDLRPGNILADSVLSIAGKVLLGKAVELTQRHISLLNTWDVQSVFIEAAEAEEVSIEETAQEHKSGGANDSAAYTNFVQEYDTIVTNTVQSFDIIRERKIIPVTRLKDTAGDIFSSINKNGFETMNYLLGGDYGLADVVSRHSVMVAYLAGIIARQMKWSEKDIEGVAFASLLHDIGSLVTQKGRDTSGQAYIAETAGLLKTAMGLSGEVILGIVQHRERSNGTGVPKGSTGAQIHPYAKIIAVADSFHNFAYADAAANPFPILDMLTQEMYGKFDTDVCQNFISRIKDSLILNKILLSDGQTAEIIFFNRNSYAVPVVRTAGNEIIDLAKRQNLTIQQILIPKN